MNNTNTNTNNNNTQSQDEQVSPGFDYLATKGEPENSVLYKRPSNRGSHEPIGIDFLSDNELSRDIDMCVSTPDLPAIKIYVGIFDIDGSCKINGETMPFLKYVIEPGSTITFPSIELACSEVESNDEYFKTETTLFLMQILGIKGQPSDPTFYDQVFRGMVFNATHKCCLAMFDYRKCLTLLGDNSSEEGMVLLTWAIVDELVFERRVWNIPVDVAVSDTMRQNPVLWKLSVAFPFAEYMVKETESGVFTTDLSPNNNAPTLFQHGDTIDSYKYGEEYGDVFIFTQKPLLDDGTGSDRKYARYAVFTDGAKYILEDQHHHEYLEYVSKKNVGSHTSDYNADAGDVEVAAPDVIYFVEDRITRSPTQMWGVRESDRFVRI